MAQLGGAAAGDEKRKRDSAGCQYAVGTPGRVLAMLQRGLLTPDSVQQVVLTDADEMVSRGSVVQICNVLRLLPGAVARVLQIILLSNTMPSDVLEAARRFMHRPIRIVVANACARVAERVDAAETSKETGRKTEWRLVPKASPNVLVHRAPLAFLNETILK